MKFTEQTRLGLCKEVTVLMSCGNVGKQAGVSLAEKEEGVLEYVFQGPEHVGEIQLLELSFWKDGKERKQRSWARVTEKAEAGLMHTVLHIVP